MSSSTGNAAPALPIAPSTGNTAPTFRFPRLAKAFRWAVVLVIVALTIFYALRALLGIYTSLLWFDAVHAHSVYTRTFATETVLFVIFGGLAAVSIAVNLILALRFRSPYRPDLGRQRWRWRYQRHLHPHRRWLVALATLWIGISVGNVADSSWQIWLKWRNAVPFHVKDPQFHRDISYYLDIYPFHRLVVTLLLRIVVLSIVAVVITGYLYGGIRLRSGTGPHVSRAMLGQLSVLVGLLLVLKVFAYRLDMLNLDTSHRGVGNGWGYTDIHAAIPGKWVLLAIAGLLALVLFANAYLRSGRVLLLGIGAMAVAAFIFGVALPGLVQKFRANPSAATLELPYIQRNINATRAAFGLGSDQMTTQTYPGTTTAGESPQSIRSDANNVAQYRLLDPNRLSATFTQLQQLERSYYGFKSTLDVDHYDLDGQDRDVVLALRELQLSGLPNSQKTWVNRHVVYTHGYGVVAAPTDVATNGKPDFIPTGSPATGSLHVTQPQVYFGQLSTSYSIAGAPPGSKPIEFNHPSTTGADQTSTFTGGDAISIGSDWRRLVYALKYRSASFLFSSDINKDSKLLSVINPRTRVAKVAPWLTLDGDVYPTVVNGRILWVVDGYTTSNNYPYSQQQNLRSDTTNTYTSTGSTVTQPSTSINYMRNSVKATVDAYTGKVTLYAWNQASQPDPLLETWEKAFPGLVQPQSAIPTALLSHLRYPQDLFNVQRAVETRYHPDTTPQQYYNGSDFWNVPTDPTVNATTSINSVGKKVTSSAPSQPSVYMTLSPNGTAPAVYSLSTPLVSLSGRNLTAFLSVNSQPGPDYGHFTLLQLPSGGNSVESPTQVQSDIESTSGITSALSLLRSGHSKVLLGNLLTVPLAGKFLYVEPIYQQATGGSTSSYPILRKVIADYNLISYDSQLPEALNGAIGAKQSPGLVVQP